MSNDRSARALAALALLVASVALLAWQINNERPSCFCEMAKQGDRGETGVQGPAGPQGEPGESCECDSEHLATKMELAAVAIESRTAIIALRRQLADAKRCCCEPTPAKPEPEVLPTPKPQPRSRLKRHCPWGRG